MINPAAPDFKNTPASDTRQRNAYQALDSTAKFASEIIMKRALSHSSLSKFRENLMNSCSGKAGSGRSYARVSNHFLPVPPPVVISEVIEHVPDGDATLAEWTRVLRPGGTLIVTTPNRERLLNRINHTTFPVSPEHLVEFSCGELTEMFEPKDKRCYQKLSVLPPLDRVQLERDKVTLLVLRPDSDLAHFFRGREVQEPRCHPYR